MNDSSRTQGGLICIGVVIVGAWFLLGLLQQSYWAIALPVAVLVFFVLGLTFWVGYTIATIQVEPFQSDDAPTSRRRAAAVAAGPGATTAAAGGRDLDSGLPAPTRAAARPRPAPPEPTRVRIALLTYRGNMYCGGQGIYAAYLAREWQKRRSRRPRLRRPAAARAGAGHPAPRHPQRQRVRPASIRTSSTRSRPFSLLKPLSLWELGVSRFGVFPEMQTFGIRLLRRWRRTPGTPPLRHRLRQPVAVLGPARHPGHAGTPVVSVIHHPLHIDREADFAIDPPRWSRRSSARSTSRCSCSSRWRRGSTADRDGERGVAPRDRALLRDSRRSDVPVVYNGTDSELFRPIEGVAKQDATCSSSGAPRTARRASAPCSRRCRCCPGTSR